MLLFSTYFLSAQNGNSCEESIEIIAGDYYVDNISGDTYSLDCTELDSYDNANLEWFSYVSDQNIFVTITSDLNPIKMMTQGFMCMKDPVII